MISHVEVGPEFIAGSPQVFLDFRDVVHAELRATGAFDLFPDGETLLLALGEDPAPLELNLVLNWGEELKRLVPVEQ